jgi:DNA helicase II / ATP-dependent DNA helicase PcrA
VGITRARKRLYLTHAWSRSLFGASSYNPPSRFLNEIPSELIDELEQGDGRGAPDPIVAGEPPDVSAGDTVEHDRFGEGVVLTVSGLGHDAEAVIRFEEEGEKRLLLAYAPLRKVG